METALYVRVEGVNLANFVEDVHDLSTIRGGSFLLLDAVERVQETFGLQPITTGASLGFFTASEGDPDTLRREIEAFLCSDKQLRHATFVVDVIRDDFARAREALPAMNRWRQFQQPTLAVPSRPAQAVSRECAFDHVRPATEPVVTRGRDGRNQTEHVSASVKARRDFGRHQKQSFYARELRRVGDPSLDGLVKEIERSTFVNDIEALSKDSGRKSLDGKIAVLHFDGNKFGRIQKRCASPQALTEFDQTLKRDRRTLLAALLRRVVEQPDGWWTAEGEIRLETLLWGGDELTWVVPAWKGWDVVSLFYDVSSKWKFKNAPLTHAAGVVFCHRSAPIHRMTKIAKELAESCKETIHDDTADTRGCRDLFAYQVLESFDEIGPDFSDFRKARLPGVSPADLVVHGSGMSGVASHLDVVRRQFPRSKLHEIVIALRDGANAKKVIETAIGELRDDGRRSLHELSRFFGGGDSDEATAAGWLHLAELWDYAIGE